VTLLKPLNRALLGLLASLSALGTLVLGWWLLATGLLGCVTARVVYNAANSLSWPFLVGFAKLIAGALLIWVSGTLATAFDRPREPESLTPEGMLR